MMFNKIQSFFPKVKHKATPTIRLSMQKIEKLTFLGGDGSTG